MSNEANDRNSPTVGLLTESIEVYQQISSAFDKESWPVLLARTSERMQQLHAAGSINIALLHWSLENFQALDCCIDFKNCATTAALPIIVLSEWTSSVSATKALDAGADSYVAMPFVDREIVARVRNVLSRPTPSKIGSFLLFADIVMDLKRVQVFRAGRPVALLNAEYRVLRALLVKPDHVWSQDQIVAEIRDDPGKNSTSRIQKYITRLRRALVQHGGTDPIRTVRGVGYTLDERTTGKRVP